MWLPLLLKQLNEADMQKRGLKLSADDIYSINHSSLKDAVVQFGGGCTGEIISPDGLLLTNHHCGFGAIQQHSSVEHDYLTDGYWAKTREQELTNPGLTAMFIVRMEDVTQQILSALPANVTEEERDKLVAKKGQELVDQATAASHYGGFVRPFFYGQEYYMFVTETFTDVRMVGAPPQGIGKFGGDTDNWMWPRHTGDFSLFRVYAGPDNKPAPYSPSNVPLKPRHFLPVSLTPVQEGDFTMVFGFPGRTTEYLTSDAVREIQDVSDPARVALRDARLARWHVAMQSSPTLRIAYAAKDARIANYWKKWIGEMRGLKRLDAVHVKEQQEAAFRQWVATDPRRQQEYGTVLASMTQNFKDMEGYTLAREYVTEGTLGVELLSLANGFEAIAELLRTQPKNKEAIKEAVEKKRAGLAGYYKDYHFPTDQLIFGDLLKMQLEAVPTKLQAPVLRETAQKIGKNGDYQAFARSVFNRSNFTTLAEANKLLDRVEAGDAAALLDDPAYRYVHDVVQHYRAEISPVIQKATDSNTLLTRTYLKGLREMQPTRKFYPDANSTLRVAYGNVRGYSPADGVENLYYTTLDGVMAKADSTSEEFTIPKKLKDVYQRRDFGQYAVNGTVPVAFIATNHTTGGNSGSPIINANGELMGLNFDRDWEGTMSDIMYDPEQTRNIALSTNYLLFVIDKIGGAGNLVQEMTLVRHEPGAAEGKAKRKAKKKK